MPVGLLQAVGEVEPIVEIGRIAADDMLEHGFQLVEPFGENGLRRVGGVVLIPQVENFPP